MFRILVSGRVFYINKIPKKLPQGFLTPSPKVPLLSRLVRFLDRRPWMILQAENKKKTSQVPTIPQKKVDVGQFCSQFKKKKGPPFGYVVSHHVFFRMAPEVTWNHPHCNPWQKRTWVAFFPPLPTSHGAPVSSSKTTIPKLWTSVIVDEASSELVGGSCAYREVFNGFFGVKK